MDFWVQHVAGYHGQKQLDHILLGYHRGVFLDLEKIISSYGSTIIYINSFHIKPQLKVLSKAFKDFMHEVHFRK